MVDKRLPDTKEIPPQKEAVLEVLPEVETVRPSLEKEAPTPAPISTVVPLQVPPPPEKPQAVRDIETVLEEGLAELYVKMSPELQSEFKHKGEETTSKIAGILLKGKDVAKKIFEAIVEWLKLIPGVNKFFLEQEAKIKTDKILQIKK